MSSQTQVSIPDWVLLAPGTRLWPTPQAEAPALVLGLEEGAWRAVKVLGREGALLTVQTVDAQALDAADIVARPVEGLEHYRLTFWVRAPDWEPMFPDPVAAAEQREERARQKPPVVYGNTTRFRPSDLASNDYPPIQTNTPRSKATASEWDVPPGTPVFFSDGTLAGSVTQLHAFAQPGERRRLLPEGEQMSCFRVAAGPGWAEAGMLCFPLSAVQEVQRAGGTLRPDAGAAP